MLDLRFITLYFKEILYNRFLVSYRLCYCIYSKQDDFFRF